MRYFIEKLPHLKKLFLYISWPSLIDLIDIRDPQYQNISLQPQIRFGPRQVYISHTNLSILNLLLAPTSQPQHCQEMLYTYYHPSDTNYTIMPQEPAQLAHFDITSKLLSTPHSLTNKTVTPLYEYELIKLDCLIDVDHGDKNESEYTINGINVIEYNKSKNYVTISIDINDDTHLQELLYSQLDVSNDVMPCEKYLEYYYAPPHFQENCGNHLNVNEIKPYSPGNRLIYHNVTDEGSLYPLLFLKYLNIPLFLGLFAQPTNETYTRQFTSLPANLRRNVLYHNDQYPLLRDIARKRYFSNIQDFHTNNNLENAQTSQLLSGNQLNSKNKYAIQAIKPIPSNDWQDTSDIWFCHYDAAPTVTETHRNVVKLTKNDIFLNKTLLIIHSYQTLPIKPVGYEDGEIYKNVKKNSITPLQTAYLPPYTAPISDFFIIPSKTFIMSHDTSEYPSSLTNSVENPPKSTDDVQNYALKTIPLRLNKTTNQPDLYQFPSTSTASTSFFAQFEPMIVPPYQFDYKALFLQSMLLNGRDNASLSNHNNKGSYSVTEIQKKSKNYVKIDDSSLSEYQQMYSKYIGNRGKYHFTQKHNHHHDEHNDCHQPLSPTSPSTTPMNHIDLLQKNCTTAYDLLSLTMYILLTQYQTQMTAQTNSNSQQNDSSTPHHLPVWLHFWANHWPDIYFYLYYKKDDFYSISLPLQIYTNPQQLSHKVHHIGNNDDNNSILMNIGEAMLGISLKNDNPEENHNIFENSHYVQILTEMTYILQKQPILPQMTLRDHSFLVNLATTLFHTVFYVEVLDIVAFYKSSLMMYSSLYKDDDDIDKIMKLRETQYQNQGNALLTSSHDEYHIIDTELDKKSSPTKKAKILQSLQNETQYLLHNTLCTLYCIQHPVYCKQLHGTPFKFKLQNDNLSTTASLRASLHPISPYYNIFHQYTLESLYIALLLNVSQTKLFYNIILIDPQFTTAMWVTLVNSSIWLQSSNIPASVSTNVHNNIYNDLVLLEQFSLPEQNDNDEIDAKCFENSKYHKMVTNVSHSDKDIVRKQLKCHPAVKIQYRHIKHISLLPKNLVERYKNQQKSKNNSVFSHTNQLGLTTLYVNNIVDSCLMINSNNNMNNINTTPITHLIWDTYNIDTFALICAMRRAELPEQIITANDTKQREIVTNTMLSQIKAKTSAILSHTEERIKNGVHPSYNNCTVKQSLSIDTNVVIQQLLAKSKNKPRPDIFNQLGRPVVPQTQQQLPYLEENSLDFQLKLLETTYLYKIEFPQF